MAGLNLHHHKVFTRKGWMGYNDYLAGNLREGEDILVFNPNKEIYEWSPLIGINFNPNDTKTYLSLLGKTIEFGASQQWLIDVKYPTDLKLKNKSGLVSSKVLGNVDTHRESFGITWNKHTFYIQAGAINLNINIDKDVITPFKESNFTLQFSREKLMTWCPITLYHNALILTEELIILTGCSQNKEKTSGELLPYALSKTLITESPINLSEFEGLPNYNEDELSAVELVNLSSAKTYLCEVSNGTPISLPFRVPYSKRELYEIRGTTNIPNGSSVTFYVKDVSNNSSLEPGLIRIFKPYTTINPEATPTPDPFPIDPYDIVTRSMGNVAGGYLQLDSLSQVPHNIKIKWDSLIDVPKLKVDWDDIYDKPTFRVSWEEIERQPSTFPTSWGSITDKPLTFSSSWDLISDKPTSFLPSAHSHPEYALKLHVHSEKDLPVLSTFIKRGESIGLLENTLDYITLNDITREFITNLLSNQQGPNKGINADLLGNYPAQYFLNASNLTQGVIGAYRLPMFTGDAYSLINPTNLVLSDTGVQPGTYTKVSVDSKGRITLGEDLLPIDIPNLDASQIVSGLLHPDIIPTANLTTQGAVLLTDSYTTNTNDRVPTSTVTNNLYNLIQDCIPLSFIGLPEGVPSLDLTGRIPLDQLPLGLKVITFVDTYINLPTVGLPDHIYITSDTRNTYIWTGNEYEKLNNNSEQLTTPRKIQIKGDGSWEVLFSGSEDVSNDFTLSPSGVIPGTYTKLEVDEKGRVIKGTYLETNDLPIIDGGNF